MDKCIAVLWFLYLNPWKKIKTKLETLSTICLSHLQKHFDSPVSLLHKNLQIAVILSLTLAPKYWEKDDQNLPFSAHNLKCIPELEENQELISLNPIV